MANLYELNKEIENFEFEIDEDTGEILNADKLDEIQLERDTKIENLCLWIKNLKADAVSYKAEEDSFNKKRKAAENKAESIKNYIKSALAGEKFKTNRVSISYIRSEQVECSDITKVDDDYLRYAAPELNKTKIKEALNNGVAVAGCSLVEKQNMIIR